MKARLDHVGVVVDDLARAKRFLADVLGCEVDRDLSLPDLEASWMGWGSGAIELIDLADGPDRDRRLPKGSGTRLDHIAFEVDDLEATIAALRAKGVATTLDAPRIAGNNASYWTKAETTDGVTYQFFAKVKPS